MPVQRRTALVASLLVAAALSACSAPAAEAPEHRESTLVLTAPELDADGYLPDSARGNVAGYCADGDNVSPALEWTGVPKGTKSFALLMTDPNDPYVHWVVTGIPGQTTSLPATPDGALVTGVVGTNSRGPGDYVGPCVPDNGYKYTLYALDADIAGDPTTTRAEAIDLMDGHVIDKSVVVAMRR
jgi:Raf kinase inhibitor-like YbhB/YbcL family protein